MQEGSRQPAAGVSDDGYAGKIGEVGVRGDEPSPMVLRGRVDDGIRHGQVGFETRPCRRQRQFQIENDQTVTEAVRQGQENLG